MKTCLVVSINVLCKNVFQSHSRPTSVTSWVSVSIVRWCTVIESNSSPETNSSMFSKNELSLLSNLDRAQILAKILIKALI